MQLIKPSFEFENFDISSMYRAIEKAGRTCYKSESVITLDSAKEFVEKIIKLGHETVLEHEKISCRVICDRGVSHEIVRHRIASYSQESTRYCNYKGGVTFIIPPWVDIESGGYNDWEGSLAYSKDQPQSIWLHCCADAEKHYKQLLEGGWSPQQARSVLPNSLKTEIVMTMNLREWRHFFKLRTAKTAHPQMREIANPMLLELYSRLRIIFEDLVTVSPSPSSAS